MKPELRPISLTIVDLMGALLPGMVWLILFITFGELILAFATPDQNKNDITLLSVTFNLIASKDTSLYVALLLCSLFIGYSIKPLAMRIAERICVIFPYIWALRRKDVRKKKPSIRSYRFPFNYEHEKEPYYKNIVKLINKKLGGQENPKATQNNNESLFLPKATQPFSSCKRILRIINPYLWEEVEYREATVRMLGSLLLAAIFSLICSFLSIPYNSKIASYTWILTSLFILIFLMVSFRTARKGEVTYTYLNFLIAIKVKNDA